MAGRTWQRENFCIFPECITFTSSTFSLTNWIQAEKELNNSLSPSCQQLANCRKDEPGARCWPGNKFALEQRDFQPLCSTLNMHQKNAGIKVRKAFSGNFFQKCQGRGWPRSQISQDFLLQITRLANFHMNLWNELSQSQLI